MALEDELRTRLLTLCPRVFTPTAPFNTARPYLSWQHIGGRTLRWAENTAPNIRNAQIQVNAWADTKLGALTLLRAVEEALCAMPDGVNFAATPIEEVVDAYVDGDGTENIRGALQTFSIWGER